MIVSENEIIFILECLRPLGTFLNIFFSFSGVLHKTNVSGESFAPAAPPSVVQIGIYAV